MPAAGGPAGVAGRRAAAGETRLNSANPPA